jgi:hypothetical protein
MRTTNVEAIYLLGDFGVSLCGNVRKITTLPEKIGLDNYERYGMPFYTGAITYRIRPEQYRKLSLGDVSDDDCIVLSPKFTGGCAKISALGRTEILGWDPYEADVSEAYRQNAPIDVTVVGTRRNVFGPLHQTAKIAPACGPGNFVTGGAAWCDSYSLIDSGLERIVLKRKKKMKENDR